MSAPSFVAVAPSAATSAGRVSFAAAMGVGGCVSFLLSLQFLTQVWVWRNWPVNDVLYAWLFVLRDRASEVLSIAVLVWACSFLPIASLVFRAGLLAVAIAVGALSGELAQRAFDDAPHAPMRDDAIRWSLVAFAFAGMFYLWRSHDDVHARWQSETLRDLTMQRQLADAQLVALKNQIEPHFLFNTLATVRRLHRTEARAGAALLADFIDYLRRAMPMLDSPQVALTQELGLLRAYLAVIGVRMADRLHVEIDVPQPLERIPIPPLLLATLVENAIKHGLTPAPGGGLLRIEAQARGERVDIVVSDTGVGLGQGSGGSGIGLANARARLRTLYGTAATLQFTGNLPHGVRAVVSVPFEPDRS